MIKILLVEDSSSDARLVKDLLNEVEDECFEITHFEKLKDSIEYLETNKTDIIFLDLSLPDSVGFNSLGQIKTKAQNTPVIVLTGSSLQRTVLKQCLDTVDDYLVKGYIDTQSLKRTIISALNKRNSEEKKLNCNIV